MINKISSFSSSSFSSSPHANAFQSVVLNYCGKIFHMSKGLGFWNLRKFPCSTQNEARPCLCVITAAHCFTKHNKTLIVNNKTNIIMTFNPISIIGQYHSQHSSVEQGSATSVFNRNKRIFYS